MHSTSKEELLAIQPSTKVRQMLQKYCQTYQDIGADCLNTNAPNRRFELCEKRVFNAKALDEDFNRTFIGYFPKTIPPGQETEYDHVLTYYWCFAFDENYYFSKSSDYWLWQEWRQPEKNIIAIHQCQRLKKLNTEASIWSSLMQLML